MASTRSTPFGELLRCTRKAVGLTQAELAERAGLSVRGINDLERGVRQTPRKDTVALQQGDPARATALLREPLLVNQALGEAGWGAAFAEGQALSLEEAIAEALGEGE